MDVTTPGGAGGHAFSTTTQGALPRFLSPLQAQGFLGRLLAQLWAASCEALARQRRLSPLDARHAEALLHFGRLIGNTDMHSGNLGLFVAQDDLAKGRFTLAPVHDMLPMRWRPDAALGGAADHAPFEPDPRSAASPATGPARAFWQRLAAQAGASRALRSVAAVMADKLGAPS